MKINIFTLLSTLLLCSCNEIGNSESSISSSSERKSSSSQSSSETEEINYIDKCEFGKIEFTNALENDENHVINELEIYEINDTHGAFLDDESFTGIERVYTCINDTSNDPYGVIKIANGDLLQGSLFSNMLDGLPAIASLNEMNFDCFVIGNHEFDWGLDTLAKYKDNDLSNGELFTPFLGANIIDKTTKETPSFIEPYTIVNKGNLKVGIIGIIGDSFENAINKKMLGNYEFIDSISTVNKYCDILENIEKVDVIILSCHEYDLSLDKTYLNSNKIDCIINGHTHINVEENIKRFDNINVPIIQSKTKNLSLGKITLSISNKKYNGTYSICHYNPKFYFVNSKLHSMLEKFNSVISEIEDTQLAIALISKKELGVGVCNYISSELDVDIAFINQSTIRVKSIGPVIKYSSIYEAIPFDNEIYIAYLTGKEVKNYILKYYSIYINDLNGISDGQTLNSSSIIDSKTYKVATVDYLALKNYSTKYFNEDHGLIYTGYYIRDFAIDYILSDYK